MKREIKLKKRAWIFRWLRKKIGLDSLAIEVYKLKIINQLK